MPDRAYDEMFDADGALRPAVASFQTRNDVLVGRPSTDCVEELTHRPLLAGLRILPIPLILSELEYADVVAGVSQRARALQRWFHDVFAGSSADDDRQLPVPADLFHRIVASDGWSVRELAQMWAGKPLADVRFIYGPDLVRDPAGSWLVLEDNVGCLGGVGDGPWVLRSYLQASRTSLHADVPLVDDLARGAFDFLDDAGIAAVDPGVVAFAGQPASTDGRDHEMDRKADTMRRLGLRIGAPERFWSADSHRPPPTAVVNLGGTLGDEIRHGVGHWFAEGPRPMLNAPGLGVLGNKALLPFVDDLIRLYLQEEPLLGSPRTSLVGELPRSWDGVLKRIGGCQGTDVIFLADIDAPARASVADRVTSWGPCAAVLQELVVASVLPVEVPGSWCAFRVELRPISYVTGAGRVVVSEVVTGRAAVNIGDRRGNLSRGAHALAVVREPI